MYILRAKSQALSAEGVRTWRTSNFQPTPVHHSEVTQPHRAGDAADEPSDGHSTTNGAGQRGVQGSAQDLEHALRASEGRSYGAYHDVEGAWSFPEFLFTLDHAQSDPYAAPSRCRVQVMTRDLMDFRVSKNRVAFAPSTLLPEGDAT